MNMRVLSQESELCMQLFTKYAFIFGVLTDGVVRIY
ncbi:hypothetical protein VCHENC02_4638, partial [Vibrio harveyi]